MGFPTRRSFIKASGGSIALGLAGCLTDGGSGSSGAEADFDPNELVPDQVMSEGPLGDEGVPADEVTLSSDQEDAVADEDLTVSVVFHFLGDDWSLVTRDGVENRLDELGIELDSIHNPEFDAAEQSNIIETLASREDELDAVISLPVDVQATANAFGELAESDIEIGLISNVPEGFSHPGNYVGSVSGDDYALGLIEGRMLKRLTDGNQLGMIEYDASFYVTDERQAGAREALEEDDDVEVMATNSFTDGGKTFDLAQNMLTANPDMDGLWTPWAQPIGMNAVRAAEEHDGDVTITSIDLGEEQAENMAAGGPMQGLAVDNPYLIGETVVDMTVQALLGNDTPPFVAVGANAVIRNNLLEKYEEIMREEPPSSVTQHFD